MEQPIKIFTQDNILDFLKTGHPYHSSDPAILFLKRGHFSIRKQINEISLTDNTLILIDTDTAYEILDFDEDMDLLELRKRIGMVFQRPNPFPLSIYDNVTYGLRVHGQTDRTLMEERLSHSLQAVNLWGELKDRLEANALSLTGEQQQRLCIARVLALGPEVVLMDEPCSALDPTATSRIEDLMYQLKQKYTIIIVTHNMQQAARVSDYTGYFLLGELVEFGQTDQIFTSPRDRRTEDYITGRFG